MAIDALCQCILFSSLGTAKTRAWSRFEGVECGDQEKLKFYTLKNPPATVKTPLVTCASAATTVVVGGRTYAVDPAIYAALLLSLSVWTPGAAALEKNPVLWQSLLSLQGIPVTTQEALVDRIRLVRALTGVPEPAALRLSAAPLRRYKPRTTYPAGNNRWPEVVRPDTRDYQFKAGAPIDVVIGNFPLLQLYQEFFFKRKFVLQNAQYVYVLGNDGCTYYNKVSDLTGAASDAGKAITAIRQTPLAFTPIATLMLPQNLKYPIKFGLLFAVTPQITDIYDFPAKDVVLEQVAQNSEFIFVPAQTQTEVLENKDLPVGTGITFPLTNGGKFTADFIRAYNGALAQFFLGNNPFKRLLPNIPKFKPQLKVPQAIIDFLE